MEEANAANNQFEQKINELIKEIEFKDEDKLNKFLEELEKIGSVESESSTPDEKNVESVESKLHTLNKCWKAIKQDEQIKILAKNIDRLKVAINKKLNPTNKAKFEYKTISELEAEIKKKIEQTKDMHYGTNTTKVYKKHIQRERNQFFKDKTKEKQDYKKLPTIEINTLKNKKELEKKVLKNLSINELFNIENICLLKNNEDKIEDLFEGAEMNKIIENLNEKFNLKEDGCIKETTTLAVIRRIAMMTIAMRPTISEDTEAFLLQTVDELKEDKRLGEDIITLNDLGLDLNDTKKDKIAKLFSIKPDYIEHLRIKDLIYLNRLKSGIPTGLRSYNRNLQNAIITRSDQEGNQLSTGEPIVKNKNYFSRFSYSPLVNAIYKRLSNENEGYKPFSKEKNS